MSKSSSKAPPTGYPEFAVPRESFDCYFDKPIPKSTFYDQVTKGIIIPFKGIRGLYKLNDSLRRMGLREVPSLPKPLPKRSAEDIARLALTMIDPVAFPSPSWMLNVEALDLLDVDHALLIAAQNAEYINGLGTIELKIAAGAGVIDGYVLNEALTKAEGDGAD